MISTTLLTQQSFLVVVNSHDGFWGRFFLQGAVHFHYGFQVLFYLPDYFRGIIYSCYVFLRPFTPAIILEGILNFNWKGHFTPVTIFEGSFLLQ